MQNREPPAYQEYATAMLASRDYRLMTATARGVLYSMRLECWANKTLPGEPGALAKILGLDAHDVDAALPATIPFFTLENGEIRCPELDQYRAHLETRHSKQSQGGKASAVTRANDKPGKSREKKGFGNKSVAGDTCSTESTLQVPCEYPASNLQGLSTTQPNTAKSNPSLRERLSAADPWVEDYDNASVVSAEAYRRASRG